MKECVASFTLAVQLGKASCLFWLIICLAIYSHSGSRSISCTFRTRGMVEHVCRKEG